MQKNNQQLFDRELVCDLIVCTVGYYLRSIGKNVCYQTVFKFVKENFDSILQNLLDELKNDNTSRG